MVKLILLGILGLLVVQGILIAVVWVICKVLDWKDGR